MSPEDHHHHHHHHRHHYETGTGGAPVGPPDPGGARGVRHPGSRGGPVRHTPHPRIHQGLVARFSPIPGITSKETLPFSVRLPVLLNGITITDTALHNEYDSLSDGQFSEPNQGGPHATQLSEIPLDTLVMDWEPKWFVVTHQDPRMISRSLLRILESREPVDLLIVNHPLRPGDEPVAKTAVTFRSMTREYRPGEADTRYSSIDIKQWRDATSSRRGHNRPHLPTHTTLTAHDTLRSLSKKYYGTYKHWRLIRERNGIPARWGGETPLVRLPGKWKPGAKIVIPKAPTRKTHKTAKPHKTAKGHKRTATGGAHG